MVEEKVFYCKYEGRNSQQHLEESSRIEQAMRGEEGPESERGGAERGAGVGEEQVWSQERIRGAEREPRAHSLNGWVR